MKKEEIENNYISKDKIKAKIEDFKYRCKICDFKFNEKLCKDLRKNYNCSIWHIINTLQELLEGK